MREGRWDLMFGGGVGFALFKEEDRFGDDGLCGVAFEACCVFA